MDKVVDILTRAKNRIADKRNWLAEDWAGTGRWFKYRNLGMRGIESLEATRFCALGALYREAKYPDYMLPKHYLTTACQDLFGGDPITVNSVPFWGHTNIMKAYSLAIERATKDSAPKEENKDEVV